ncbi:MAG TPA: hypothetical protein VHJ34_04555 [Actinomycetota bacterium]|nr:hypothetical protein [Actinomycetota bacterium]
MTTPARARAGVLVVRAWLESDGELRARITYSTDVEDEDVVKASAASEDDVVRAVRTWLDALVARARRP